MSRWMMLALGLVAANVAQGQWVTGPWVTATHGGHGHHSHGHVHSFGWGWSGGVPSSYGYYSAYRPSWSYSSSYNIYSPGLVYSGYAPYTSLSVGIAPQYFGGYPNYGYSAWYGGSPYGWPLYSGWPGYLGGYYSAPIFIPAETMYGPGAVRRFMGIDPPLPSIPGINAPATPQLAPLVVAPAGPAAPQPAAPGANPPRPVVNDQQRARAQEHLRAGDQHFRGGRYHIALQRYKDATTTVPDLADGFMRQGWALVALGQYDVAARAVRKALQLKPDWHTGSFRLSDLYPAGGVAESAHRDSLERAAAQRDTDPQLAFLAGLFAWADRDMERARRWFTKAKQHEIGEATYITTFLSILPPVPAAAPTTPPPERANPQPNLTPPAVQPAPATPPAAPALPAPGTQTSSAA